MKKIKSKPEVIKARAFDFDQFAKISNDNNGVLNRGVDPNKLNKDDIFICIILMEHVLAFGEEVEPHLRVRVTTERNPEMYALQDMTLEQYWSGVEIELELETSN